MEEIILILIIGITAFIATNLDDLFLVTMFFSDPDYSNKSIFLGYYIGQCLLIIVGVLCYFAALMIPVEWIGLLGIFPVLIGFEKLIKHRSEKKDLDKALERTIILSEKKESSSFNSPLLIVTGVTVANSGDDIGIYVPLFVINELSQIIIIISIFLIMTGIWCIIPYYLVNNEKVGDIIKKYGQKILPFFLIGLGIFIFLKCGTFTLFF